MGRRAAPAIGIALVLMLTGCASGAGGITASSAETSAPAASPTPDEDAVARAQAQAWLDAAELPPGAVRASHAPASFNSYTGWVCRPVAQLEAFWTVPGSTPADVADWLLAHPTAGLVTTYPYAGERPASANLDGATLGFIPADGSYQGIVYTVVKTADGVAVRAEIAALTASATCQTLPPGESWGLPGQG
jgi:hypothetical protein